MHNVKQLLQHVSWLGHAGVAITGSKTIVIDPFQLKSFSKKADVLLVSHDHFDHLSLVDIGRVRSDSTIVCASAKAASALGQNVRVVTPGSTVDAGDILVSGVAAYNTDKFRAPGVAFHPPSDHFVGFVFSLDGITYYHAGDTDFIEEMHELAGKIDVAFLPVSGTYVMTAEEAGQAADAIQPKIAVPLHFGSIVGTRSDALDLQRFTRVPVVVLDAKP